LQMMWQHAENALHLKDAQMQGMENHFRASNYGLLESSEANQDFQAREMQELRYENQEMIQMCESYTPRMELMAQTIIEQQEMLEARQSGGHPASNPALLRQQQFLFGTPTTQVVPPLVPSPEAPLVPSPEATHPIFAQFGLLQQNDRHPLGGNPETQAVPSHKHIADEQWYRQAPTSRLQAQALFGDEPNKSQQGHNVGGDHQPAYNAGGDKQASSSADSAFKTGFGPKDHPSFWGPKIEEASTISFTPIPTSRRDREEWITTSIKRIAAASGRPKLATEWINAAKAATNLDELQDDGIFETLSSKASAGLIDQCKGLFLNRIKLIEKQREKEGKGFLNGRQLFWLVLQEFKTSKATAAISNIRDLFKIEIGKGRDALQHFQNEWNTGILAQDTIPPDDILETLYATQIYESTQFAATYQQYRMSLLNSREVPSYTKLHDMVERFLEEERKFAAQRKMIQDSDNQETPKGFAAYDKTSPLKQAGDCHTWINKGNCPRRPNCQFNHPPELKGAGKGKSKGSGKGPEKSEAAAQSPQVPEVPMVQYPPTTPNSNKKHLQSQRGKSPSGKEGAKLCHYVLNGKCNNGDKCGFWHPPICRNFPNCARGDNCTFFHQPPKDGQ